MSYPFRSGSDRTSSKHRDGSLQKKREIEKIRRQQQFNSEEATTEPVFSQPRKITPTERQDSLTRNIANVLGDPGFVSGILFREPNIWLGTSRTEQSSNLGQKGNSKQGMQYSSPDKAASASGDQRSSSTSKTQHYTDGLLKSESRHGERRHVPRLKHPRPVNRSDNSNYSQSVPYDRNAFHSSNSGVSPGNWPYPRGGDRLPRQTKEAVTIPSSTISSEERDRSSSVDSDMLGVENILKEMVDVPTHITGIKTPTVNDNKFCFTQASPKTEVEGPESSIESAPNDGDTSSDSESSDSSFDEPKEPKNEWNLDKLIYGSIDANSSVKSKPVKRKLSDVRSNQSPKIQHVQSRDSPRGRQKTTHSSRSNDPSRSKHTASASVEPIPKQQNPRKTPNYAKHATISGQAVNSNETTRSRGRSTPSGVTKVPNASDNRHRQSSASPRSQGRLRVTSESSSSSSDSSGTDSSDNESDSHDDFDAIEKHQQNDDNARTPLSHYPDSSLRKKHVEEKKRPVSSRIPDRNPVQEKSDHPVAHRHSQSPANITVKPEKDRTNAKAVTYPSLWVRIRSAAVIPRLNQDRKVPFKHSKKQAPHNEHPALHDRPLVSVGSETDQPFRRAKDVQVAVAQPSDWTDVNKVSAIKSHRDNPHWNQSDYRSTSEGRRESTSANTYEGVSNNCQSSFQDNLPIKPSDADLPDSSLPGEQERIESSDYYMREGRKKKHDVDDGMAELRAGRTRPGDALVLALSYFEAALYFLVSGFVMESENHEDRLDAPNQYAHSPVHMYQQILPLLSFVLKMRSHFEPGDVTFEKITVSCLRCQSFLYLRIFQLKKDTALKNSELITKHFEPMGKTVQIHSPWRSVSTVPNVLSPMSPAVPSPFSHRGPSPAGSNSELVSSSTQAGKMTPTSHNSMSQKTYDLYRQQHSIMCNLLQAHEKWDLAESLTKEHADFFRNIDALSNITLTFHSSLWQVFRYYKMVLLQLRALMNSSPSA